VKGIVTGGAGFLGSHVADVLAESGHDVTVVDLTMTERHRSMKVDLRDIESLSVACRGSDFVCHLAAVGDVYLAAEKPYLAAATNVTGSANVCEAAIKAHVPKVIYASTWEVYGAPRYQPIDEEHPCAPDHPYGITKLAGERLALAYGQLRERLSVTALRLGTAYGTRMRPNSVFSLFIRRAVNKQPITIQGTGRQSRQFTHARDIGRGFALAIERAAPGFVFNIVGDESITIKQLADLVIAEIPTSLDFAPAREAEVPSASVSNAKAKRELGWQPQVPFGDGLRELVAAERSAMVA